MPISWTHVLRGRVRTDQSKSNAGNRKFFLSVPLFSFKMGIMTNTQIAARRIRSKKLVPADEMPANPEAREVRLDQSTPIQKWRSMSERIARSSFYQRNWICLELKSLYPNNP